MLSQFYKNPESRQDCTLSAEVELIKSLFKQNKHLLILSLPWNNASPNMIQHHHLPSGRPKNSGGIGRDHRPIPTITLANRKLANMTSLQIKTSTIILTLDGFGNTVASSFYHQTLGLIFRGQNQATCNVLTCFDFTALPIQINTDYLQDVIPSSANIYTPTLTSLMNTHDKDLNTQQ